MILGIGVDILQLIRFKSLTSRRGIERVARRILSQEELVEFDHRLGSTVAPGDLLKYLAVRWAVKEAAYKALYPSYKATWKELTLLRQDSTPKPALVFTRSRTDGHRLRLHVSISHDGDYIIAQVVAETP
ncbi:hypothetical protein FRB95_007446 [Tulasnella sp. JGI-2019a]|nr:hypothetical protein FRB95_007446 [Tulasnella sp. JGI-2019a]